MVDKLKDDKVREFAVEQARTVVDRIYATFPELQGWIPGTAGFDLVKVQVRGREKRATGPERAAAAPTKVHWTQTPEGKRKMARAAKKAWKTRNGGESK